MPTVRKQTSQGAEKSGVWDRIRPIRRPATGMKVSIYGRSGTGKTTFACTFPKPLLLIGAEDGTQSVYDIPGVEFVRLENTEEIIDIVGRIPGSKYKTVVLDSASSLQDMILREILGRDEADMPAQKSYGMCTKDQWAAYSFRTKERINKVLQLSCDVVITAQEKAFHAEEDASSSLIKPYIGSAVSDGVYKWLNPMVDYICQTFLRRKMDETKTEIDGKMVAIETATDDVEYCLRTRPDELYTGKFRLPKGRKLPGVIVDPTYKKLQKIIEG